MCDIPIYDYQILKLTQKFYRDYPNPPFTELMTKDARSYNCLLVETSYDYFICIPYRTEIRHKYAYKFTGTQRSMHHKSGLDYTKIIIIKNPEYVDNKDSLIDKDEYNETIIHIDTIVNNAVKYVEGYVNHCNRTKELHNREFSRKYGYTTLKYFHKELGIN